MTNSMTTRRMDCPVKSLRGGGGRSVEKEEEEEEEEEEMEFPKDGVSTFQFKTSLNLFE